MNSRNNFHKSIELWAAAHPKEAHLLPYVDVSGTSLLTSPKGYLNLKASIGNLYSSNPIEEAAEWARGLKLEGVEVLYVYGLGLGYYYLPLKDWLHEKNDRQLIFIEDELPVIAHFFETELALSLLKDPQVQICYLPTLDDPEAVLESLYWATMMARIKVEGLESYKRLKSSFYENLSYKISYDAAVKNALVDEYLRYGASFFRNFYPNMLDLHRSYWGNNLFGKFEKVPAIICGAGPSLEKQVKELNGYLNRALIFAGGSSLNVLSAHGVQPHFGAGIDPNPAQYTRLSTNLAYEVPFFYRNRLYSEAFQTIRGPRLYISGAGGYDVSDWFEEKFGLKADFLDEGHNVVNFCIEIAKRMGCSPIILVGMDLAFTGMKAYASGVVDDANVTESELLKNEDEETKAILRQDIHGQPIYTLWKWIAESDYISAFAKNHPELEVVNATEGGIGFKGIKNEPFLEAAKKLLVKDWDLKGRVHGEIQLSAIPQVTASQLHEAMVALKISLEHSVRHLAILIEENEKLSKQKKLVEPLPVSGRAALSESDLAEEPGYQFVLEIFNAVYTRILGRRMRQLKKAKTVSTALKQKVKLQLEKLIFLQNVAKVNIMLIDHALEGKSAKK